jgi:hypothetical protein
MASVAGDSWCTATARLPVSAGILKGYRKSSSGGSDHRAPAHA